MAGRDLHVRVEANSQFHVSAAGTFIFFKTSTGALGVETESGKLVDMVSGDKLISAKPAGFAGFVLHNPTGVPIIAVLVVGFGDYDKASVVGNVTITKAAGGGATTDVPLSAGTSVIVSPVNLPRREVLITNLDVADTIRVNISNHANATVGTPLLPGQTVVLTTTAAIYAWAPGGSTISVAVLEVVD